MIPTIVFTLVIAVIAGVVYLGREQLGAAGAGMALFRTIALGAALFVLFNPLVGRASEAGSPLVLVDASLSLGAVGGRWAEVIDSARQHAGDPTDIFRITANGFEALDSAGPIVGQSAVAPALRAAAGINRSIVFVTDGEVADASALSPSLLDRVTVVTVPRDSVPGAALVDVQLPERVLLRDSLRARLVIATWDWEPATSTVQVDVMVGSRQVATRTFSDIPRSGQVRRTLTLPVEAVGAGEHVLEFRMLASGDEELRDNIRARVLVVSEQPNVVLIADPADIEARFLARELVSVGGPGVVTYARVRDDRWIDMQTMQPVAESAVRRAADEAVLRVVWGEGWASNRRNAVWRWRDRSPTNQEFLLGDWYVSRQLPPSPLADRVGAIEWDSLPPLTGMVRWIPQASEWVALTGQLGRRGAEQPIMVGRDSAGVRQLTTTATGLWRWVLRGGAAHEAFRTVLSSGVDWLLDGASSDTHSTVLSSGVDWLLDEGRSANRPAVTVSTAVPQGTPVVVRWNGSVSQDSVALIFTGPDSTIRRVARFDALGTAEINVPIGVYRWSAPAIAGTTGVTVVETFSPEFYPQRVSMASRQAVRRSTVITHQAREWWWIFGIAMLGLLVEWGWRQRRGLP